MRRPTTVLALTAIAVVAIALFLRSGGDTEDGSCDSAANGCEEVVTTTVESTPSSSTTSTTDGECASNPDLCEQATTTSTTTTTVSIITLPDGVRACDLYESVDSLGTVASAELVEASGLASSRVADDVLWSHNDSRGGAVLHAFSSDGSDLGAFEVPGAFALDWEDIAAGPGPDGSGSFLYVGDMGDNFGIRGGDITIWRVPDVDPASLDDEFPEAFGFVVTMPDGPYDAEALFVDPVDRKLFVATKSSDATFVFSSDLAPAESPSPMELVATLFLDAEVSGADMSPDGGLIAFRGYRTVWMWDRLPGESVTDALAREPCEAPSPEERQGEAIAVDGSWGYFTVSEGSNPTVHFVGANL